MGESEGRRGAQPGGTIEVSHLTDSSNKQFLLYKPTNYCICSNFECQESSWSLFVSGLENRYAYPR